MKILFTVATYWPKTDGVQMMTQILAERLVKIGHEVWVISSKLEGQPELDIHNGVNIIRMDAYNYLYWHRGNKKEYQQFVINKSKEVDAVVAVCLQSFAADWLLDILDEIKCRKVLYLHGMPDFKLHKEQCSNLLVFIKTIFRNYRWKGFYKRNANKIKKFDYITHLFYRDNSYNYFKNIGYLNNKVIENTCNEEFFYEEDNIDNKNIIYVGNYCQRKNQIMALECFYEADTKDYSLTLIGSKDNQYYKKLIKRNKELISIYGEKKVSILYGIEREQIITLTKQSSFCLMTSTYEYYPITIVEAMAAQKAFLSTNVGIVKKLPGGVVVDGKNDLIYWIEYFISSQLYKKLGKIGFEYAESNLKADGQVNKLIELLI